MNIQSARNVAEFVHVLARDSEGRPTHLNVPGHKGRRYSVILERNGELKATCNRLSMDRYLTACQGNQHCVCYHVLASCIVAASDQGKELSWCESEADAERLARIDGKVFIVESAQSGKLAYGVVKPESKYAPAGLSKSKLIELAIKQTSGKQQWYSSETVILAEDAYLKNDDGCLVRLYRIDRSQKYPKSERLAIIWYLDIGNVEAGWQRYTAQQAHDELFDKDDALPAQHSRGQSKLFKT